ncbi:MAG TPA: ATP-binding protein [Bacteroidales bacterium]|nr:ATP-binding protein [Bacteroidales bacterium]
MIKREAESELLSLAKSFKAVAVIGPRQSGKTTLTRYLFSEKPYVNLENPDDRRYALDDPRGFLSKYINGAVIDEVQRVPELFSYLQQILDGDNRKGRFILTGSNNFLLQESISQSLAGRIGYLYLLPFTINEVPESETSDLSASILKGFYPPVYDKNADYVRWYSNYIRTYVERDVRQIKNITNLNLFDRFIRLSAGRAGQMLNMNNLALECGVDNKTAGSWLGILESSFIVFRLQPHHRSYNKRVVKMPKLYFYDTGLICSLLGIHNVHQLELHPLFGSIFENLIVSELVKRSYNRTQKSNFYFWRDNTGHEIDILIDNAGVLFPVEIKSGKTISSEFFKGLLFWFNISSTEDGAVIYAGEAHQRRSSGIEIFPWNKIKSLKF